MDKVIILVITISGLCGVTHAASCIETLSCITTIATDLSTSPSQFCSDQNSPENGIAACEAAQTEVTCPSEIDSGIASIKESIVTLKQTYVSFCGEGCEDMDVQQTIVNMSGCPLALVDNPSDCTLVQSTLDCIANLAGDCKAPIIVNTTNSLVVAYAGYTPLCPDLSYNGVALADATVTSDCGSVPTRFALCSYSLITIFGANMNSNGNGATGGNDDSDDDGPNPIFLDVSETCGKIEDKSQLTEATSCIDSIVEDCPESKATAASDSGGFTKGMYLALQSTRTLVVYYTDVCFNTGCTVADRQQVIDRVKPCMLKIDDDDESIASSDVLNDLEEADLINLKPSSEICSTLKPLHTCLQGAFDVCPYMYNTFIDMLSAAPQQPGQPSAGKLFTTAADCGIVIEPTLSGQGRVGALPRHLLFVVGIFIMRLVNSI